jgi:quercetin dioxygenase-like cupin family protein
MKVSKLEALDYRAITQYGSEAASIHHLVDDLGSSNLVIIRLEPSGSLGMHPAVTDQLFIVVQGSGTVSTGAGDVAQIEQGEMAFWQAGEEHQTNAGADGLTAIVIEGGALAALR